MNKDIEFGGWVSFHQELKRRHETRYSDKIHPAYWRVWKPTKLKDDPRFGIFIGTRTLQNGYVDYDYDAGNIFVPKEYVTVALVCCGPRSNPIYVPLEALHPEY
jgi:hypothetical protein